MRFIIRFSFPTEIGNERLRDPQFGQKLQDFLKEIKAEAAYFTPLCGERGGFIVVSFDDPARLAGIGEQLWIWLSADVEFIPVMSAEDLGRAMPEIKAAQKKYE